MLAELEGHRPRRRDGEHDAVDGDDLHGVPLATIAGARGGVKATASGV
jgi:hypothetical protein